MQMSPFPPPLPASPHPPSPRAPLLVECLWSYFCRPRFENAEVKSSSGQFQFGLKVHRLWEKEAIVENEERPG